MPGLNLEGFALSHNSDGAGAHQSARALIRVGDVQLAFRGRVLVSTYSGPGVGKLRLLLGCG